jgi:hypothetical protein
MVDIESRNRLAESFRHLVAGLTTNDEYEDSIYGVRKDDLALKHLMGAIWTLYDDTKEHKLDVTSFSKEDYQTFARFILFLKSDQVYKWPDNPLVGLPRFLSFVFTLGIYTRKRDKEFAAAGDIAYWPFLNKEDFDLAKQHPKYLSGNAT